VDWISHLMERDVMKEMKNRVRFRTSCRFGRIQCRPHIVLKIGQQVDLFIKSAFFMLL
jgi:hypothetical protein